MKKMTIIPTIPPYAPYIGDAAGHHRVSGVRLNTVMPIKESLTEMLSRIKKTIEGKDVWIDLKCRQIRTSHGFFFNPPKEPKTYKIGKNIYVLDPSNPRTHGVLKTPPWAELKISHKIKLDTSKPVKCYFSDGINTAYIVEVVDGDKLIMLDGPKRVVGGGESINIMDPSLEIEGFLTDTDYKYIEAAKKVGIHTYMLSYVEKESDITEILALDPDAKILVKIESRKGLSWVKEIYPKYKDRVNLMSARGDLYVEMGRPDKILRPLKEIVKADHNAVLASRILSSLRDSTHPSCSDITDIACMLEMGYHRFMVGDEICFNKDVLLYSMEIINAIGKEYGI